ncbi:MAG TPA: Crp/Fnr family transcriptional regulator [Niastella sp.]
MTDSYDMIRDAIHRVSEITDNDWDLCKPGLRYKKIQKGKHFVEEGKTYKDIAFVISGLFRAYYVIDGEEINCDFYFEGQWPKAYHSFLTQTPSRMWIQALEDAEIFLIGYDHLQNLFTENKNWERFGRIATENAFVNAQVRNEMLLLDKPQMRYLHLLESHPHIFERVPLYHIASYLGIKQPSLSRIRKRLQKIQPDTRL